MTRTIPRHEMKKRPVFILNFKGFQDKSTLSEHQTQEYVTLYQLQQLLICCFVPSPRVSFLPNWFKMIRCHKASCIGIFIIDGIERPFDDKDLSKFKHVIRFEVEKDWIEQLLSVNLTTNQIRKLGPKVNSMIVKNAKKKPKISRMDLVLSPSQLLAEGFIFPSPFSNQINTSLDEYSYLNDTSPLFALDCEMCLTKNDILEVTRFSLVDENLNVVLDTLVKPSAKIKDYLTRYSGITKKMLDPVKTTLDEVKLKLKQILPKDAILCGQSLNFDLKALNMFHPYVIDTSVIFNSTGHRKTKTGLKSLTFQHLGKVIQNSEKGGHNSIEDALATLKLVQLKLQKGLKYGDYVLDKNPLKDTPVVPFERYIKLKSVEVKIFYDYYNLDNCDKFVTIISRVNTKVRDTVKRIISKDKSICLVLTHDGYCYIKV